MSTAKRLLSALLTFSLVFQFAAPAVAYAAQDVEVENHNQPLAGQEQTNVSGVTIDGVEAPRAGSALDGLATVSTAEGKTWDVPVFWVDDGMQVVTQAEEGRTYLPAIAFFMPREFAVEGVDAYAIGLSDSLIALFGGAEIVSVYDASSGITFILPASLKDFFPRVSKDLVREAAPGSETQTTNPHASNPAQDASNHDADDSDDADDLDVSDDWGDAEDEDDAEDEEDEDEWSLVDVHCGQTARDAFSDEDLEWLLDLIVNKLQPQAVELLLNSFPAFRTAAENGEIGREIGLYVYYGAGDQDGIKEHATAPARALAYVSGEPVMNDDVVRYCYMIGVELSDLAVKDANDNMVKDEGTGKFKLLRSGKKLETFQNTIVHELFHALMDDYNRTGMVGGTNLAEVLTDDNDRFLTRAGEKMFAATHYPLWFVEGTASSVENVYDFRNDLFKTFRQDPNNYKKSYDRYTEETVLNDYLRSKNTDGSFVYADLGFCTGTDSQNNEVDTEASRYVSGYLATLYLSELAARKDLGLGSSITTNGDVVTNISSQTLRMGLNSILERMHKGETLDQVINDISPTDDAGNKIYEDTDDFSDKFIKGVENPKQKNDYQGDVESLSFVTAYLNYLQSLETENPKQGVSGSILFDFDDKDAMTPLDMNKDADSDYLKIVESNRMVESTVPNDVALAGGGKSKTNTPVKSTSENNAGAAAKVAAPKETVPKVAASAKVGATEAAATAAVPTVAAPAGAALKASASEEATAKASVPKVSTPGETAAMASVPEELASEGQESAATVPTSDSEPGATMPDEQQSEEVAPESESESEPASPVPAEPASTEPVPAETEPAPETAATEYEMQETVPTAPEPAEFEMPETVPDEPAPTEPEA